MLDMLDCLTCISLIQDDRQLISITTLVIVELETPLAEIVYISGNTCKSHQRIILCCHVTSTHPSAMWNTICLFPGKWSTIDFVTCTKNSIERGCMLVTCPTNKSWVTTNNFCPGSTYSLDVSMSMSDQYWASMWTSRQHSIESVLLATSKPSTKESPSEAIRPNWGRYCIT